MQKYKDKSIGRFAMLIAVLALAGVMAFSSSPKYSYGATVDAVSSATTIATPTLSSVVSVRYDSLKLTWTSVSNATNYQIYRSTSATGTFSRVATVTGTTFTNSGLVTGKYYYYKVRAAVVSGSETFKGSFSAVKGAKPIPSTPSITLSKASATSIKVSWGGVAGATRYAIYRTTSATGTYTFVYSAPSTARYWINTGLTAGKTYFYKVRVYHLEGTTKVFSKYSTVKSLAL
jgi:fibronectin type 3 domain-containing protein